MYVVTVHFILKDAQASTFMPLMIENARASRDLERGCLRFDVCSDPADPNGVFLYEIYTDQQAFKDHLDAAHFKSFDQATSGMIASKHVRTYALLDS